MKILAAIPTYKRPEFLPDCIQSALGQRLAPDVALTVAVVDNDAERSAHAVFLQTAAAPCPFVYLHEPQTGLSRARNKAIEFAIAEQMDAVLYVDDDMRLPSGYLQKLVDAMRARRADAVRGIMRIVDADGNAQKTRRASLSFWRDVLAGNGVLVGRKIYGAGAGELGVRFDPRYHPGTFEDGDFFYHAHVKGARLCQIDATFDELRLPDRMHHVGNNSRAGLYGTRQRHVHIRKFRGGVLRAARYVLQRVFWLAMQIVVLAFKLPFAPVKSARKIQEKSSQIAGLVSGLFTPHYFFR